MKTVIDPDPQAARRADEACKRHGLERPSRYLSSLSEFDDTVHYGVIAAPHNVHFHATSKLLNHSMIVLKEKPFARTMAEAVELAPMAHRIHVLVDRPYQPEFSWIQSAVQRIGPIERYRCIYLRAAEHYEKTWRNNLDAAGGGVVLDMGYNVIDMLMRLFGPVASVSWASSRLKDDRRGGYRVEERAKLVLSHRRGLLGTVALSRIASRGTEALHVLGRLGTLSVSRSGATVKHRSGKRESISYRRDAIDRVVFSIEHAQANLPSVPVHASSHEISIMDTIDQAYRAKHWS